MNNTDNIYDTIKELLGDVKNSVSIIEDQIDRRVQDEYFNFDRKIDGSKESEEILKSRHALFDSTCSTEERKFLLCNLAKIDHIDAYRTLEKYTRNPENPMHDWAILALKENKMLLKSRFLDESQVLISTGLGGKGLNLRYFIVLLTNAGIPFSRLQRRIVKNELFYACRDIKGELEQIRFNKELCILLACIPLRIPINLLIDRIIHECNQLGEFLHDKYIVTNVKKFSLPEIRNFLHLQNGR